MLSSFSAPFDLGRPVRPFGLDPANRPEFYLDAGLTKSYSGSGATWTDIAPNGGNNGTITGPTFSTDRFTFDGSNDYVSMPSGFADFTSGITCFFVAKFGSGGSWERLLDFGADTNSNANDHILFARQGTGTNLAFELYNGDGQPISLSFIGTGAILNNELATYAVTLDGANAYMYRNGVQIATTATAVLPSNVTRIYNYIGRSNWASDAYFQGDIAVAMLFDRALTAEQIASNHNYFAYRYNIGSKYTIEQFTTVGSYTWRPPKNVNQVEYLVVGGGGGGGNGYDNAGGGGGAGGMVRTGVVPVSRTGWYGITVGAGGAGGADTRTNNSGSNGSNSVFTDQNQNTFDAITSLGGGYGKGCRTNTGSGEAAQVGITTAPTGGDGNGGGTDGGGGGGATGAGGAGGGSPGAGGAGLTSDITGSSVTYGVGGAGGYNGGPVDGAAGTTNRGNGGVGGSSPSSNSAAGGAGGSGIVILKYAPIVAPVSTDLIYHLDASQTDSYPTTGTAVSDLTGTYGDSTLANGPTFTQDREASYWSFDGSNDILYTADMLASFGTGQHSVTLEIWMRTVSDNGVIASEQGTSPINAGYHTSCMEIVSGNLRVGFWNGSDQTHVEPGAVTRNQWQQYVVTYDDATNTLTGYIDAGSSTSTTFAKDPPTAQHYYALMQADITHMGDGSYLAGDIAIFRVYDRALSSSEVTQNFNSTKWRFGL